MKYSQATLGRVFVIRLEDGDIIHEEIERLAREESIQAAALIAIGGADDGSKLIAGPEKSRQTPVVPIQVLLEGVHEITGTGTIFPDPEGNPILHMHIACGRDGAAMAGCIREGVKTWHVMEIVLFELLGSTGVRKEDQETGFHLLDPSGF